MLVITLGYVLSLLTLSALKMVMLLSTHILEHLTQFMMSGYLYLMQVQIHLISKSEYLVLTITMLTPLLLLLI